MSHISTWELNLNGKEPSLTSPAPPVLFLLWQVKTETSPQGQRRQLRPSSSLHVNSEQVPSLWWVYAGRGSQRLTTSTWFLSLMLRYSIAPWCSSLNVIVELQTAEEMVQKNYSSNDACCFDVMCGTGAGFQCVVNSIHSGKVTKWMTLSDVSVLSKFTEQLTTEKNIKLKWGWWWDCSRKDLLHQQQRHTITVWWT